ncbi:MAG: enoyl-CoA hydratase, partial [Burkholderiales bacterium]|nr:enoyl-CoA hydratase [Burkholderiales bacterium]
MTELVTYSLHDGIATLTLANGKVNAISPDLMASFNLALDQAEQDKAVVIVTGQPGILSGGYDLKVMMTGPQAALEMVEMGSRL